MPRLQQTPYKLKIERVNHRQPAAAGYVLTAPHKGAYDPYSFTVPQCIQLSYYLDREKVGYTGTE